MYQSLAKIFLLLGISCCCMKAAGQEEPSDAGYFKGDQKFYGGIIAGMNISTVTRDNFGGYHLPGLNAGAIVYWHFANPVGMSLELLYSQKGAKGVKTSYSPYAGSYYEKYTMKLNYFEVPLMVHYFLSPRFQFGIGGSYSALMSSKETYETIYPVYIDPDKAPFEKYEIDFITGGSMQIYKGLMLDIRYQYSLTPTRKAWNVPQGLGVGDQHNNMFTFRLAYLF